ncbi:hypothetical protein ACFX2I_022540 [Malus domestica]
MVQSMRWKETEVLRYQSLYCAVMEVLRYQSFYYTNPILSSNSPLRPPMSSQPLHFSILFPANSSTERLEILDDESHVISFSMVGGDHRLLNYRSASTETPVRRDTTPIADDSSTGLSDAIPAPACNAMIFEALSASTDPNGLDTNATASFIEGRMKGNEC